MPWEDDTHSQHFTPICRVLTSCRGKEHALTLAAIAERVGTDRRTVEMCIEENLARFPWPIVACGKGLYLPTCADDINRYRRQLHRRHRKMQIREATLTRKARACGYPEEDGTFIDRPTHQPELF